MPTPPISPCVNICSLDEHGYCKGCYRTLQEIASWSRLTPDRQWQLIGVLRRRAASRGSRGALLSEQPGDRT